MAVQLAHGVPIDSLTMVPSPIPDTPDPMPGADVWRALAESEGNALAWLDARGRVQWSNAAFAAVASAVGTRAVAQALAGAESMELSSQDERGQQQRWRMRATRLDGGGVALVLRDVSHSAERLAAENERLRELLDMAQVFGRLGVWERDPRTLEGRWDRHVFRFFGIDAEQGGTPNFKQAVERIDPADRVDDIFRASLAQPGDYSARYRVLHPGGGVRHIHSQWRVLADARGEPDRVIGVMVDDTDARALAHSAEAANAQLALALSLGKIGTWRHDLDSGMVHYDSGANRLLGHSASVDGVPLDSVRSWIHPDDLAQAHATFARTLTTGESTDLQCRYRHADGSWRVLLTRRARQSDARGRPVAIVGVALDVTEQFQRDQQALQLARRLEAAAEAARIGLWSGTLDDSPPEWNALMYTLVWVDPAQGPLTMGELLRRCVHRDDCEHLATEALTWLHSPTPVARQVEFRVVWPDGSTHWLQLSAHLDASNEAARRAFGVLIDVSEQRQMLLQLREAHERATLAMGSAGMGTWYHDRLTGHDDWDAQMFALRGLAPARQAPDAAGRLALVHPDDRKRVVAASRPFEASTATLSHEFRVIWPDGSVHWLASRSTPLLDDSGRMVRRIGVNWDITEAKRLEQVQRERELALRESQAKAQFLARMSHELRTPLNAVLGFTQLLLADADGGSAADRRHKLERLGDAGQRLLSLVDGVLELSAGQAAPSDVASTAATPRAAIEPPSPASGSTPRVLYIEDNPVNTLIVREVVAQRPHLEFHSAVDGASGIERACSLQPALVLIDMQLPDLDGIEVLRRLRADAATAQLTCIALSANAMPEDIRRARAAGFADYWTKPIDVPAFLRELDRWVRVAP